jgi:hypothetical protein
LAAENAQFDEIFDLYFNQAILASRLGLGLQINLQICGFYEGLKVLLSRDDNDQ